MTRCLSYYHGAGTIPLLADTIGGVLRRVVERLPDGEALVCPAQQVRWTWRELSDRSAAFAAGLLALGLRPGDRVGIWLQNYAEWVVAEFALARAGLICVTLNPAYRQGELEYALNRVTCRAVVIGPAVRGTDFAGIVSAAAVPSLEWIIQIGDTTAPGCMGFDAIATLATPTHHARLAAVEAAIQFDAPVCIQFTSGTTGLPKGATLSHHNVINNAAQLAAAMRLDATDRLCAPVPMFHCFGYVVTVLVCALSGVAMVFPGPSFDPLSALRTVQQERCTALHGVPTMFIAELGHPAFDSFDLSTLRTGCIAGALCPEPLMRQIMQRLHMTDVLILFGMTETSPVATQTRLSDPPARRIDSVGRAVPHVEVKVIDADGRVVPVGAVGEFCVRGYSVMLGYWDDSESTRAAIDAAGWIHTGDLVTMDSDGYCRVVGRSKDMIKFGGEAIFPREIEELLLAHPAVQEAYVFGVVHAVWGEEVCAWVRCHGTPPDAAALRAYCRARIARHKVPRHIRFVDSFPMTGPGKARKDVMRAEMAAILGRVSQ